MECFLALHRPQSAQILVESEYSISLVSQAFIIQKEKNFLLPGNF